MVCDEPRVRCNLASEGGKPRLSRDPYRIRMKFCEYENRIEPKI